MNIKKQLLSFYNIIKQPLIATILGLLVGLIFIIVSGKNPIEVYFLMFKKSFFEPYYFMQTLTRSTPVIICGISTAIAWRAGYINIGVEGQMISGAFASTICAIYIPINGLLGLLISIVVGMTVGGLYASIVSILNIKFKTSIVISTLMMNYIANYIASYFVSYPFRDQSGDGLSLMSKNIPEGLRFFILKKDTTLNLGIIIAILVVLAFLFMANKMVFGYESKMTGLNPNFAKYGGVTESKVMLKTLALSGAVAALAGICEIFGYKYRYIDGMFTSAGYAWTGLMAALIANLHPIGILFTSIFLSGLQVGGQAIQRTSNIPLQMATVIQSSITLFVSVKLVFSFIKKSNIKIKKDKNKALLEKDTGGNIE